MADTDKSGKLASKKKGNSADKQRRVLEELLESAQDAMAVCDNQGRIIRINPEFTRLFGYSEAEANSHLIHHLIFSPKAEPDETAQEWVRQFQKKRTFFEAVHRHRNGCLLYVFCYTAPIMINGHHEADYIIYRDITKQKKAEQDLKVEKAYFQQLFEIAQEGVVMTDLEHRVIFINDAFTRIFGFSQQEAKGRSIDELVAPTDVLPLAAHISNQVTSGKKISFEALRRRKSNDLFDVACVAAPIEVDGKQVGNYAVYRDISQHKKAEQALETERAYLKQLFESAQEAIVMSDMDHRIIFSNIAFMKVFGYSPEEARGKTIDELVAPGEKLEEATIITRKVGDGNRITFEGIRRHKDNSLIHVSCVVTPIVINNIQVGHYGVYRDISGQKQAEEALQREEAFLKQLFEASPMAIVMLDRENRVYRLNEAFTRLFGYQEAEVRNQLVDELVLPADQLGIERSERQENGGIATKANFESRRRCKDGTLIDVAILHSPVMLQNEHLGGYVVYQDITERKRAEEALRRAHNQLEIRVLERTAELAQSNRVLEEEIQERQRIDLALRESEVQYRRLFEQSNDAVIIHRMGQIIDANQRACEMLGYSKDQLLAMTLTDLLPKKEYPNTGPCLAAGFENASMLYESWWLKADGSLIDVEISTCMVDPEKKIAQDVARNITERKQAEAELKLAKELAEEANRSKSDFLANMSHEIRTPMNAVIGMTGLILDTELTPEQADYAETVRSSAENLLQIINDILDFSKIEAGKLEIEIIEFNLRTAVEEVADMLATRAFEHGLEFACDIDTEAPSLLLGDPGRLKQILINLTNNAIKFTEKGSVVIRVSLKHETDVQVHLHFSVEDSGIGIPEIRLHRLFQSFSQIDASTTRRFGGTGLGLAISKQLVEKMGGKIGVHSQEGKGSTFFFTIVFDKQIVCDPASEIPEIDLSCKRLLIVDDYAVNCEILGNYIKSWGCYYEAAASAQEALHLLFKAYEAQQPFDLVLTDHMMPGMDGETLGRAIKSDPRLKEIIMVMLTSRGMRGDAQRMKEIGFSAYLTKPIKRSLLYNCLVTALARNGPDNGAAMMIQEKKLITRHSIEEANQHHAHILIVEDNAINQKLVLRLLSKFGYRAEAVANGIEALRSLELIPYDLVLMDVQMPEMDGLEATLRIRSPESRVLNPGIPIIALTAHALAGDRESFLEAGMDDYISKPIQASELFELLQKHLSVSAS